MTVVPFPHGHSTFNANDRDDAGRKQSTASDPTVATYRVEQQLTLPQEICQLGARTAEG